MKKKIRLELELTLCDRYSNFGEIINSIQEAIKIREGVDKVKQIKLEEIKENGKEKRCSGSSRL